MSLSFIHPDAKIGTNVTIEPFSYIAGNVEIGDGCHIGPYATLLDNVKLGKSCKVYPGAVIGGEPQDIRFDGEETFVEIGDNTILREFVTVNRGTVSNGRGTTIVGSNCMIMAYCHIAHDCHVADHVILTSYVGISGLTDIEEYAIIGGHSALHQFVRIGAHAMLSGGSIVGKDVPPYSVAGKRPVAFGGVNVIGLRRRGFPSTKIEEIREIYKVVYYSGMNITDACTRIEADFTETPEKRHILDFIRGTKRGIIKGITDSTDE